MCPSSSVLSVSLCLLLCVPPCLSSGEPVEVKVKLGENATLPCQSPGEAELKVMKWTRPGQSQNSYVFFYRGGKVEYKQHLPSYSDRVGLKDPEMKNGDVSVVLSHVNINDAGRYQCLVVVRTSEQTSEVLLTVQTGSSTASVVETYEGSESVQLPCYFPTFDLSNPSVVWRRSDLRPPTVHQRLSGGDNHTDQNQDYRGRTSMWDDALETGDLDLFLRNPTTRDSGDYTCIIRWKEREHLQSVTLRVKEPPPTAGLIVAAVLGVLAVVLVGVLVLYCICSKKRIIRRRGEQMVPLQQLTGDRSETVKLTFVDTKVSVPLMKTKNQQQETSDQRKLIKDLKVGDLGQIMEDFRDRDTDRGRYICRVYSNGVLQREMTIDLKVKETPQVRADGTKKVKRNNSYPQDD